MPIYKNNNLFDAKPQKPIRNKKCFVLKNFKAIQTLAAQTIRFEAEAINKMANYIDTAFAETVETIFHSRGRLIVTGIGKSANIAQKIVATMNSTGTPSVFMHAADAIHGDLGIIQPEDTVMCLSKSGNTPEIKVLVPLIKRFGNPLIGMVSNTDSFLGRQADYVLKATIEKEACPNNLAPTTSTTAQIVLGDALAVCLLSQRSFSSDDFAKYHPGGALGKKLYLRVADVYKQNMQPKVYEQTPVNDVIMEISSKLLGATAVINARNQLVGIITDGDLRRMLQNKGDYKHLTARDIMTESPQTIAPKALAIEAFNQMEDHNITQLLVAEGTHYVGVVHLHNLLKEGIV